MFDIQALCNFLVKAKKSTYASGENAKKKKLLFGVRIYGERIVKNDVKEIFYAKSSTHFLHKP